MRDARLLNYGHLHFIVFIWGFTAVLGALISIDSIPLVWWRMGIATVLIFIYMLVRKIPFQLTGTGAMSRKRLWMICAAGMIIALHWITFFGAIKASNVSVTLAMMSTGAFFTSMLEPLFTPKKFVWYELLFGLLIAYAFIASVKVMKYLSAYTVMLTTNLEPVYGILLAFFILGDAEQMTPEFYIGAVVILLVIITNGIIKTRFRSRI